MLKVTIIICLCATTVVYSNEDIINKPHIVLIVADDLGWNDVSFHGSNQIPTPNIDALAYNGIILNRFYTEPSCTPSRAALLSGQYPIRFGFQGWPMKAGENRYLPFDVPLLPEKLKELGYANHLVGKWHLGSAYRNVTPTSRGFDSHFGYWNGFIGYFDHEAYTTDMHGLDFHENHEPLWSVQNEYVTHLLTQKAEKIIRTHNESMPLFLMLSHLAPHSGKRGSELEVPDIIENNERFGYIKDERRRLYAGMVHELDKSVGNIMEALSQKGILENTLVLFFSDNGGQTEGLYENRGSNWPLRGIKLTVLEGGVRCTAIMYGAQYKNKGAINNELIHIADLMPTLIAAAGGDVSSLKNLDGMNQLNVLIGEEKLKRTKLLVNIDEAANCSAFIGENGRYKLINGKFNPNMNNAYLRCVLGSTAFFGLYDGYYGEDAHRHLNPQYNITAVLHSATNKAIGSILTTAKILQLRHENDLSNCSHLHNRNFSCNAGNMCLFDLIDDPCETTNVASKFPDMVAKLSQELFEYWKQLQPQKNIAVDPKANPIYFNHTWHTWLDDDVISM